LRYLPRFAGSPWHVVPRARDTARGIGIRFFALPRSSSPHKKSQREFLKIHGAISCMKRVARRINDPVNIDRGNLQIVNVFAFEQWHARFSREIYREYTQFMGLCIGRQ
jgi:hypothetical protein